MSEKLVVCVCAYLGRHTMIPYSIASFANQSYKNRVLLIFDDSNLNHKFVDMPENVIVKKISRRFDTLGHKRQAMMEYGKSLGAELLAHWDDDDMFGVNYLSDSISFLENEAKTELTAARKAVEAYGYNWDNTSRYILKNAIGINSHDGSSILPIDYGLDIGYKLVDNGEITSFLGSNKNYRYEKISYREAKEPDFFIGRFKSVWHACLGGIKFEMCSKKGKIIRPCPNYEKIIKNIKFHLHKNHEMDIINRHGIKTVQT